MKIGVSSYSFSPYRQATGCDYFEMIRLAKEMGFDGIEFITLEPALAGAEDKLSAAKKLREACAAAGLEIFSYTVGANLLAPDAEAEVAAVCAEIDVAEVLGVKTFRHDASFSLKDIPGYTWEDGVREMAPLIRRIAAYGEKKGIRTCSENHGYIYQAPERVRALIEAVGHPNYGWLFDMGNFEVVDRHATEALPLALPYIVHVHAKDMIVKPGAPILPGGFNKSAGGNFWRGTLLGHGAVDIPAVIAGLRAGGYDGTVSLEFEGMEDNLTSLKIGLQYLRDICK